MSKPIRGPIRDMSPCNGCTEKFEACHGNCPKDARGEKGYGAWLQEAERVKNNRKEYNMLACINDYKY